MRTTRWRGGFLGPRFVLARQFFLYVEGLGGMTCGPGRVRGSLLVRAWMGGPVGLYTGKSKGIVRRTKSRHKVLMIAYSRPSSGSSRN